ncbi:MAG: hypothetical protein ACR2H2_00310 [Solirubrobacteraceae bacterium]
MDRQNNPAAPTTEGRRRLRVPLAGRSPRTRSVLVATGLLVLGISPFAVARTGGSLREGVRNGTTVRETEIISRVGATTTPTGGYATRQSNLSSSGGGAVYGCRSQAGGSAATPRPQNPCVRANNLSTGFAFEFNASNGDVGGLFSVGTGGDSKKPFVTNATGVATGLNADRVDGKDAADMTKDAVTATQALSPLAQVTAAGAAGQTRGVPSGGVSDNAGLGDYNVVFTGDLSTCALSATVTGTDPGQVTVTPTVAADKSTTAIDVRTFDGAGVAADRGFHLSATC